MKIVNYFVRLSLMVFVLIIAKSSTNVMDATVENENVNKTINLSTMALKVIEVEEELKEWAKRVGIEIVTKDNGSDPSSVMYEACDKALKENYDISIYFEVYYKGDLVKTLSEHELQDFIKILDSYTICTIENLLLK